MPFRWRLIVSFVVVAIHEFDLTLDRLQRMSNAQATMTAVSYHQVIFVLPKRQADFKGAPNWALGFLCISQAIAFF